MPRSKRSPDTPQARPPAPAAESRVNGPAKTVPPDIDCQAYDQLTDEVSQLQELTGCPGWGRFFGSLLREADEARGGLEFAEKPRDVIRLQATIALVKSQLKKLQQPVEDLNALRTKWPLFHQEMPWRADFDEATGRVALTWTGKGEPPTELPPVGSARSLARDLGAPLPVGGDVDLGEVDPDPSGNRPEDDDPFGD